ncbi:pyrrolo-quinoline quinone [Thermotoga sp. KOL6]|nr:pyrrolo-quinoline quinone [Thermotoga sp. KOL6]
MIILVLIFLISFSLAVQLMTVEENFVSVVEIEGESLKSTLDLVLPFTPMKGVVLSDKAYFVTTTGIVEYDLKRKKIDRELKIRAENLKWEDEKLVVLSKKKVLIVDPITFDYETIDLQEDPTDVERFEDYWIVSHGRYISLIRNDEEYWKIESNSDIIGISVNKGKKSLSGITKGGTLFIVDLENPLTPKVVYFTDIEELREVEWLGDFLFVFSRNKILVMSTIKLNSLKVVKEYTLSSMVSSIVKTDDSLFFTAGTTLYRVDVSLLMKKLGVARKIFLVSAPSSKLTVPGELLWKIDLDSEVRAPVTVGDGFIVLADVEGLVHVLSISGKKLWSYKTGFVITAPPRVFMGRVYVTSWDDHLYALSLSGHLLWKVRLDADVSKSFEVNSQGVYVSTDGGEAYLIDHESNILWQFKDDDWISTGIAVDDRGTVYFGTSRSLYSLYPNGTVRWKTDIGYLLTTRPVVIEDYVFVGSNSGWLFCVDRSTGGVIWKEKFPLTLNTELFAHGKHLVMNTEEGVYIVDLQGGVNKIISAVSPSPVVVSKEGYLFFVSNGILYSYTFDGQKRWEERVGETNSAPALGEERVVVATREGIVYCFFDKVYSQ